MLSLKEKFELILGSLSDLDIKYKKSKICSEAYTSIREKVVSEDMFFEDNPEVIYTALRDLEKSSYDYIKILEKQLSDLEGLVVEFGSGVAQSNAELIKTLSNN